jgi:L-alanine-DL-glutamate epimerase-like enolase superfamily enzyme
MRTRLKLGYGEREWTEANYDRVLEDGLSDVLGLDHGRVGGVTASWRIACKVRDAGLKFNSHSWSGSILSAVGLAVSCASGAALMFELKPLPDAMQTEVVEQPLLPVDRLYHPPSGPGIGVQIREDVIANYRQA